MLHPEDVLMVVGVEGGACPIAMTMMTAVGEVEGCCCCCEIQARPPVE